MSLSEKAPWHQALKLVPARWRIDFVRFLEEGEANDDFLAFLVEDANCRQACELVLRADQEMAIIIASSTTPLTSGQRDRGPSSI
jgi:hypothetical protein